LYKKTQASINEKDSTLERLHDELDNAQKKLQTSEIEAKDKALAEKGTSIEINIRFSYF
jgi:peptidoglycan hydrolase CwlO-like protein